MASAQPSGVSTFSFAVNLRPEIRPLIGGSTPATGYHQFTVLNAVFYEGTEKQSPRIGLELKVVASQQEGPDGPIEDTTGAVFEHALWLGFLDPSAAARMKASGGFRATKTKTEDQVIQETLDKEEGRFKGFLCALGHKKEDVASQAAITLSPALFVGGTVVGFYERSWHDDAEEKWYGPYFTPIATGDDAGAKAKAALAGKTFGTLYNAERMKEASGRAPVGGGTIGGGTTLGAVGPGQGLGKPGGGLGQPNGGIAQTGGLGQPGGLGQAGGLGQPNGGAAPANGGLGQPNGGLGRPLGAAVLGNV